MIIRDIFCKFCIKTYIVTPHLNRLSEMVQMMVHNIYIVSMRNKKNYQQILSLI